MKTLKCLEQDISEIDLKTLVIDSLNEALTNEEGLNIGTHKPL